jgi:hypothetical protein
MAKAMRMAMGTAASRGACGRGGASARLGFARGDVAGDGGEGFGIAGEAGKGLGGFFDEMAEAFLGVWESVEG